MDGPNNGRSHAEWSYVCSRHQIQRTRRLLGQWQIQGHARFSFQIVLSDISHNSYDRSPRLLRIIAAAQLHTLANRIAIGPIGAGHLVVDNQRSGTVLVIVFIEETALEQGNPHGLEIPWTGGALVGLNRRLTRSRLVPLDGNPAPTNTAAQWQNCRGPR